MIRKINEERPSLVTEGDTSRPELISPASRFASPYGFFKANIMGDYSLPSSNPNREYLDPYLYDLAFYNKEGDGEPIFVETFEIYIEDNDLYFKIKKDSLDILKNLKINNVLASSFILQSPSEFYVYDFDSIEEITLINLFTGIYITMCLKNINKNYIKSLVSSIRDFSQIIEDYDEEILKDKNVLSYKEKFIKNFKNNIDNFLKYNSLDWLYQTSSITDEEFFFVARFYDNITYVPNILKEDFLEIYGGI